MNLLLVCVLISLVAFIVVITPFFVGKGGRLAPASSINDPELLTTLQANIVQRYISEEKSFVDKHITEATWKKRREFLENKYIDVTRRLDFLHKLQERQGADA